MYHLLSKLIILSFFLCILSAEFDYVTVPPGADSSISAEDGGNGFDEIATSLGYTTHTFSEEELQFFGDEKAIKGGRLHDWISRFPATMRLFGKEANYLENYWIKILCYEPLLERHPLTWESTVPRLASHWKISQDKMSHFFDKHNEEFSYLIQKFIQKMESN